MSLWTRDPSAEAADLVSPSLIYEAWSDKQGNDVPRRSSAASTSRSHPSADILRSLPNVTHNRLRHSEIYLLRQSATASRSRSVFRLICRCEDHLSRHRSFPTALNANLLQGSDLTSSRSHVEPMREAHLQKRCSGGLTMAHMWVVRDSLGLSIKTAPTRMLSANSRLTSGMQPMRAGIKALEESTAEAGTTPPRIRSCHGRDLREFWPRRELSKRSPEALGRWAD